MCWGLGRGLGRLCRRRNEWLIVLLVAHTVYPSILKGWWNCDGMFTRETPTGPSRLLFRWAKPLALPVKCCFSQWQLNTSRLG